MNRKYSSEISAGMDGQKVKVAGWVHEIRDLGGLRFFVLRDRDGTVQVTLPKKFVPKELFDLTSKISRESVVVVTGAVRAEQKAPNGYEITPEKIEVLSSAASPLPLDPTGKVNANIDTRLDSRVMDLRRNEIAAIFKIRAAALDAGRSYLRENGFIEVHTPRIISTSSEGGTELFPITYFEREAFLAQSPQLYKQMLMATGFDRVCEIATYFRAEEHNTVWHLNEITAIDCETAFIDSEEDVIKVAEGVVCAMLNAIREKCAPELRILTKEIAKPETPFPRVTYDEALKMLEKDGLKVKFGEDFSTEVEKRLGDIMRKKEKGLYFVTKYPLKAKPFYTMPDADGVHSNSFDLEFRGREIASGAQRIHDYELLVKQIKAKKLNPLNFASYLEAFRFGMPPHGGFGLGIERFLTLLLDLPNIREAVLFPRDRKRLTP